MCAKQRAVHHNYTFVYAKLRCTHVAALTWQNRILRIPRSDRDPNCVFTCTACAHSFARTYCIMLLAACQPRITNKFIRTSLKVKLTLYKGKTWQANDAADRPSGFRSPHKSQSARVEDERAALIASPNIWQINQYYH